MTTFTQRIVFLAFLGSALLLLPACGGSGNVKSKKASETVLNPDSSTTSGTADIGMPGEKNTPINAYVEKIKRSKSGKGTKISLTPSTAASTPEVAAPVTSNQTPVMDTTAAPKKSGSHWILWTVLIAAVAGIGWYFWSKGQSDNFGQPKPPVGGLSPVSGFTGVKNKIEDDSEPEPSFWSKKLF